MAYITLDQFIDKYSKLIDNDNLDTKALLVKMLSELSNSDISELTILLNKEGINIFNFLNKNEYDTIKLFDGKFNLNDLQTYFDDEFGFPLNIGFYEKYSMQEIVKLLNEKKDQLKLMPTSTSYDHNIFRGEEVAYGLIFIYAPPDDSVCLISYKLVSKTGIIFECCQVANMVYHPYVGCALNYSETLDKIIQLNKEIQTVIIDNLREK